MKTNPALPSGQKLSSSVRASFVAARIPRTRFEASGDAFDFYSSRGFDCDAVCDGGYLMEYADGFSIRIEDGIVSEAAFHRTNNLQIAG